MKTMMTAAAALIIAVSPLAAQTPSSLNFIAQQSQTEVLGTDFTGTEVVSKDGQKVGTVDNLVFDQTGRMSTAVIGVGGFLGVGKKEVAIPFDSLKSDLKNNKHVFVVDATKEQLTAAPAFKTLNDQAFNQRIADWRGKATESYNQLKQRASKAYQDTKATVKETVNKELAPTPTPAVDAPPMPTPAPTPTPAPSTTPTPAPTPTPSQ